jgi:FKBP-type peptidyl-prolyl cis-trans isomerase (trigger factor)
MQVKKNQIGETTVEIIISSDGKHMQDLKTHVLQKLAPNVNVPGFRKGAVPPSIVEKHIDGNTLQTEFLD